MKKKSKKHNQLKEYIQQSKDAKTLLKLLLSQDNRAFENAIQELESLLYHDSSHKLQEIKEKLLKQL